MDTAVGDVGPAGAVERDDNGEGPWLLAVGAVVVRGGVLDAVAAVGVDLCSPDHSSGAQVLAGLADGLRRHDVVPRAEDCVGDDDGDRDVDLVVWRGVRVSGLVDAEPVEVRDALDAWLMLVEQVEDCLPERLGDADLGRHAAFSWVDGPRYAEPLRAR